MRRISSRKTLAVVASTAVAALGLAACGSSGSTQSSSGTITIGVMEPLSGGFSGPGESAVNAVKMAVADINSAGGIKSLGGKKLSVVSVDSTTDDPTKATAAANDLAQDHPAFVVGPFVSAVSLPASTVFERAHIPECVGSFSDDLTNRGYKYLFELPPTATQLGDAAVKALAQVVPVVAPGADKVAAIYDSNPGEAVVSAFAKSVQQSSSLKVVLNEQFPSGLTNAAPLAQKIKSSGAQVLVPGATTPELELILGALSSLGQGNIPIFNPGGGAPATTDYVKGLKNLVNGQFVLPTWDYDMKLSPAQNQLLSKINTEFTSKYKQPFMGQFAGEDYVCTQALATAMNTAKSSDPTKIRDAMSGATFTSGPASLMPPGRVHFNENGLNDAATTLVSEWCDGKLTTVSPKSLAASPIKSPKECGR